MGTEFFRGVSGGERKRTNIGMELIIEPQILFLDEPTTGLDACTAVSVVQILKRHAKSKVISLCVGGLWYYWKFIACMFLLRLSQSGNRIVIMSIHQPRYSIFKLFDSLTMLSLGNLVYHGPTSQALIYFNNLGNTAGVRLVIAVLFIYCIMNIVMSVIK